MKFPKEQFLRADHSIDLNKARKTVVNELCRIIGDVRDFNGGMISKQNEVLGELKALLQGSVKYSDLLLENFFYSLTPVIMRNVLDPEALRTLFVMLLESIEDGFFNGKSFVTKTTIKSPFVYVMIKAEDRSIREELGKAIGKLQLHSTQLAASYVSVYEVFYLGYIFRSPEPYRQQQFNQIIQQTMALIDQKDENSAQVMT